jgi:hypothetical protein
VVADGALTGVAGEVGLRDPSAAPAENLVELHVAYSFLPALLTAAVRAV